jgi:Ca2+-transporting ATPase
MFGGRSVFLSLLQGLSVLAVVFIIFLFSLYLGKGENEARTMAFTSLVFANLMLISTNLSWDKSITNLLQTKNPAFWLITSLTVVGLLLVLYQPFLNNLFHFSLLHLDDLLICLIGGIVSLLWFEALKLIGNHRH